MSGDGRPGERLARALLRLYPTAFRSRFGDEFAQLAGDLVRDARAGREGSSGVVVTWLRIVLDVVRTAPAEHLEQRRVGHSLSRPASALTKTMGLLGILGGTFLVAVLLPNFPWTWLTFNLRLVPFEAGAIAVIVAITAVQVARSRVASLLVAAPAILANAWHMVMTILFVNRPQPPLPDPEFRPLYALAAMTMWFANAAFAIVALRLGVVPRWGSLALFMGSLLAVSGFEPLGLARTPLASLLPTFSSVGILLVGLAWILLGLAVATRRRPRVETPSPAAAQDI